MRFRRIQTNITSGELDPELAAREDTPFYYSGLELCENVVPNPQGGGRGRDGFEAVGLGRGPMSELDISSASVTAPLGSNAANGIDDDEDTEATLGGYATPDEVVYTIDYGSVPTGNQVAIDLILLRLDAAETQVFEAQYSTDNAVWTTAGTITVTSTEAYSRRIASAPGANFGTPRYWRIRRSSGTTAGAFFAEVKIQTEGALGEINVAPFTFAIDTEYALVITGGNVDIYSETTEAYLASACIPHGDAEVTDVTWAQSLDTILLFHKDVPIWRLFRLGSDDRWDFREQPFESVQEYPWNDSTVSGGVNEKQALDKIGGNSGDLFVFFMNGVATDDITYSTDNPTLASNIETALEAHIDITSVTVTNPAAGDYLVEFTGVDGERPWPLLAFAHIAGEVDFEVERTKRGREPMAPLWDADHGYPRCGTFYQGRLYLGGFRDQSDLIAGSRVGRFFDMELDIDDSIADDSPLQFRADSDEQVTVVQIHGGRHLQYFTSSGEFYSQLEPITPENLSAKETSRTGAAEGLPVVDVEGGTFYVSQGGDSLREYLFVDTEQSYSPGIISLLAGHLVAQPRSVTLRRSRSKNDAAIYYLANTGNGDDGVKVPAAAVSTLRSQQVTAFFRITSRSDTFEAFAALQDRSVWTAARRSIDGADVLVVERANEDALLDSGRRYVNPDFDQFDAAQDQTVFTYTFTSPAADTGLRVWTRASGEAAWIVVDSGDYTVDLGLKTVTFTTTPRASGADPVEVRINLRIYSLVPDARAAHLIGETVEIMADRYPVHTDVIDGGGVNLATSAETSSGHGVEGMTLTDNPGVVTHPQNYSFFKTVEDTSTGRHIFVIEESATIASPTELQVDVRPINGTAAERDVHVLLGDLDIHRVECTLSGAGTIDATGASVTYSNIEALGDDWYRITLRSPISIIPPFKSVIAHNGDTNFTGDGESGLYVTRIRYFASPGTASIDLLDNPADFEVQYGFGFERVLVTMPDRGEDKQGPLYQVKKRIPKANIQARRCGDIAVGPRGRTVTHMPGFYDSTGEPAEHIEAALLTGTREIAGMRGWTVDANLEVRGVRNMDFGIFQSATGW